MMSLFTPRQHQHQHQHHDTQLRELGLKLIDDLLRIGAERGVADDAGLDAVVAQGGSK